MDGRGEHFETTDAAGGAAEKWYNYDVLRHYNSVGTLVDHFLPRWGPSTAYVVKQVNAAGQEVLSAYDHQQSHLTDFAGPLWGPQGGYAEPSSVGRL